MEATSALLQTEIPNQSPLRGKVRDNFDLGDRLLIVASDRISAFDVIMANGIPDKGAMLTQLSLFWFDWLGDSVKHHLISSNTSDFPDPFKDYPDQLDGRSMLVKKVRILPVECIVRGYVAGSGWKEYQKSQTICDIPLPAGLKQCEKLPEPIFTPSTKAEQGMHDENISVVQAAEIVGAETLAFLSRKSLEIYSRAADYAAQRGIILADTKFEFGLDENEEIILADEILTPDSSRFWPADKYEAGRDQESFDKQYVRNYLETINFDKKPPGPTLPDDVVSGTRQRYAEAYEILSGKPFE